MKRVLITIIVCASLIVAALLIYQIVNYGAIYFWMIHVDKTYHPFKDFDEYRDDYMAVVGIIKRNMSAFETSDSNVVVYYSSESNTRIKILAKEPWEISDEEKKSIQRVDEMYPEWSTISAYEEYIWFQSEDGSYGLSYSLNGKVPPTVNAKNGSKYYKPVDLGGDWYAFQKIVE